MAPKKANAKAKAAAANGVPAADALAAADDGGGDAAAAQARADNDINATYLAKMDRAITTIKENAVFASIMGDAPMKISAHGDATSGGFKASA
jgi:hypothetical protein